MSSQQDERARGSQEGEETNQGAGQGTLSDEELEGASGGLRLGYGLEPSGEEDDEDSATRKTDGI